MVRLGYLWAMYGYVGPCRAVAMQSKIYDVYTTYLPLQLVLIKSTEGFRELAYLLLAIVPEGDWHSLVRFPTSEHVTSSEVTCTNEVSSLEALGSPAKL